MSKSYRSLHHLGHEFDWQCFYCNREVHCARCNPEQPPSQRATRDHYYPKSQGGLYLVLACWKCNHVKGNRTAEYLLRHIKWGTVSTKKSPMQKEMLLI